MWRTATNPAPRSASECLLDAERHLWLRGRSGRRTVDPWSPNEAAYNTSTIGQFRCAKESTPVVPQHAMGPIRHATTNVGKILYVQARGVWPEPAIH
eukprot:5450108-Prymnesium_polylepis.1